MKPKTDQYFFAKVQQGPILNDDGTVDVQHLWPRYYICGPFVGGFTKSPYPVTKHYQEVIMSSHGDDGCGSTWRVLAIKYRTTWSEKFIKDADDSFSELLGRHFECFV